MRVRQPGAGSPAATDVGELDPALHPRLAADRGQPLLCVRCQRLQDGRVQRPINIFEAERAYEPETNWTYEIGTRQTLLDRRLFANLTLFYIDWTDQQVVSASAAGAANNTFIANAARSTSKGFELELNARPTDGLEFSAALALADAQFDEFIDPALVGIDRATGQRATLPDLFAGASWPETACSVPTCRATQLPRPQWQADAERAISWPPSITAGR
jgi:outer membrane receptor for Fe3+-dicitrate